MRYGPETNKSFWKVVYILGLFRATLKNFSSIYLWGNQPGKISIFYGLLIVFLE